MSPTGLSLSARSPKSLGLTSRHLKSCRRTSCPRILLRNHQSHHRIHRQSHHRTEREQERQ